jgi:hypothetical protein
MTVDKLNTGLLADVLTYVLENEQQHYEESGKPDDHIYVKALTCALQLNLLELRLLTDGAPSVTLSIS